ncbi:MAG: M48 family metallopeptidase [Planctomycetota bacterium]
MHSPSQLRIVPLPKPLCISLALVLLISCAATPITGRKQLLLMPEHQEIALGLTAFEEALRTQTPSTNAELQALVGQVGQRLAKAANRPDYDWEFRLVSSPEQNAFALPGGKVAVYEGILPLCQNEAGLAVVMAHEIAHVLARHGGERMSHKAVVNGAGSLLGKVLQNEEAVRTAQVMRAYGVGSEYLVVLPYSRQHESEADHMGMMLMAEAGYDPAEAPRFWQRFATDPHDGWAEFLSTHPSDERRWQELQKLLPQAMGVYQGASEQRGLGQMLPVAAIAAALESFPEPESKPEVKRQQDVRQLLVPSLSTPGI